MTMGGATTISGSTTGPGTSGAGSQDAPAGSQPKGSLFNERRRVLIVEDDHDFAESLSELLESLGFAPSTVHNAAEALARLSEFSADLALIDVKLGTDNGVSLVPMLKAQKPNLVCILMTAYAELDSAVGAVRSGAYDYLLKPLSPQSLPAQLNKALGEQDKRERREREQRLVMMGSVCANIAHDVNNCLQVVRCHLDIVDSALQGAPPDTQQAKDGLGSLSDGVKRAAEICWHVLEFAKGSTLTQPSDAASVLLNCRPMLARMNRAHVDIEFDAPKGPIWVALGATQLEQVVTNLVMNAVHAVGQCGRVRVELLALHDQPKPMARIRVVDNGVGIPREVLPRIFDPYFSTKPRDQGTGLGLSIVYGMVTAVPGGDIQVDTEPGFGSCFTVTLPILAREA